MANTPELFTDNPAETSTTEAGVGAVEHIEPTLLGLAPYQIVAVAMAVLIAVMLWKKVPGMITGGLDARIAAIREQLDEAKKLRAEAEALRDEYRGKITDAEKNAVDMIANAEREADGIRAKAATDSEAAIARRQRMAEDKIAAAEREAVEEVRARAARAAAVASRDIISSRHTAEDDKALADSVIASI